MYILKSPSIAFKGQNAWEQFLSTHPTKECDTKIIKYELNKWNFNPRTPQKSATAVEAFSDALRMISIHAPYKRVRLFPASSLFRSSSHFNPRTLQESATPTQGTYSFSNGISIHAPYKRVRLKGEVGADGYKPFQSTHPTKECDYISRAAALPSCYFNPRTLQESATRLRERCVMLRLISIHAPYKRVRPQS